MQDNIIIECNTCFHDDSNGGKCSLSNADMVRQCFNGPPSPYPLKRFWDKPYSLWKPMRLGLFDIHSPELPVPSMEEIIKS